MQKITPCLWFDDNAEEAVKFYTSLFWQIVPSALGETMRDPEKSEKVMKEVLPMEELDLATLEKAYAAK
jgi:predicted 3-demethylubiquinone-9 3-methyltransferase (glyoxalase superfamily)